jgi:conjugative relaxase-like TrwC/TraI family protein
MRLGSRFVWMVAGVLSVAKLTLSQEAYYEQQVARGLDDYYAARGESPGIWAGSGSERLGLAGVVEDGDLGTLLRGVNPASEAVLRAPARERTITVRTLDVESGEWREEEKRLAPVSGYDLVFSCPKSVSLLHALTEDERIRREVSEAHESAWQAAVGYLEREACVVRRGKGGAVREHGEGFVAAAFRHRTSRAQDPHLHTHVIVANLARTIDGEWRALDGEAILKTYRLAAGYLYEAQLRHELTRRLGLAWTQPVKGMAELERVPDDAIRAFSTRRQSLVEHMEALGTEGFAAARVAALATREAKEQVDLPRLREQWRARAAEHGLGRRELRRLVDLDRERTRKITREQLAAEVFGREGLTASQTTFTTPELVRAVAGSLRDGAAVAQVLEAAEELARFPGVELLELSKGPGRPARFTTLELLRVERRALELALAGLDVDVPRADKKILARTLMQSGPSLTGEQRALVLEAASRPDRVVCVVGAAGAGKTTALRVLADVYRESAVPVLGAVPSGRAADELAGAAGVASSTLYRLLLDARRDGGLPRGCVLVVDETGMAETRVLAPLLELVERAEGKAILVGDPVQLPAVGAGGLYPALCAQLGAISLVENRRQRDLSERQALARLRAGDPEPYLSHAARAGRLQLIDDMTVAKQRLLEDWWLVAQHDLHGAVMLAYRRTDVRDLNESARTLLIRAGRLGPQAVEIGEHEFSVGDRVLCRRNDPRLGVRNGMRGTVVDLDETAITLRTQAGATRLVPLAYAADHLEHGYALTGHAAQGATVERAFVLLSDHGALQEWGYVACSRARTETRLYLAETEREHDTHARQPNMLDAPERTARALARSSAEPLALAHTADNSHARLFAQQQRQLDQQRRRTQERLAAAEHRLKGLDWRDRRRDSAELRSEIALYQTALRLADEKLSVAAQQPPTLHQPRPPRRGHELVPSRSRQPRLEREPPVLGLER